MIITKQKENRVLFILSGLCICGLMAACGGGPVAQTGSQESLPAKPESKVSSYIRTWPLGLGAEQEQGVYWTAADIQGEYLKDLIISFALIDQNDKSSLYIPDLADRESAANPGITIPGFKNLWNEVAALKKQFPKLKINLSVGGWGAEFSDTAHDPELRAKFITNVQDWLEKYNLDGIDIDWEYPVGPDWGTGIKARQEDRENYISLLTELRAALDSLGQKTGKRYKLSTAVPASGWFIERNNVIAAADIVDALKLMAYDYCGAWSQTTGHHANLQLNPADPSGLSTAQVVDMYINAGVPAHKIVLGVPFYCHAWKGVAAGESNGLFQKHEGAADTIDQLGWTKFEELLKPDSGYTRYWDDAAKAPYLYNGDIFISYIDPEAITYIAEYAKEKGLGGLMTWEYAHDINATLLKVLDERSR